MSFQESIRMEQTIRMYNLFFFLGFSTKSFLQKESHTLPTELSGPNKVISIRQIKWETYCQCYNINAFTLPYGLIMDSVLLLSEAF